MNLEKIRKSSNSSILRAVLCGITLAFYVGALFTPDLSEIFSGLWRIVSKPAVLTKDYFFTEIGSVSGTMLNYALTGTFFCALMFLPGVNVTGITVAAYGLSVGFCGYGVNILNILPFQLGVLLYSKVKKETFAKNLNFAMFSCALCPLVSEMLWRYPNAEVRGLTVLGVALAILVGIVTGMAMPALCAHAQNFHKGYDLYNAGPAAGFLCFALFAMMYKSQGITAPAIEGTLGDGQQVFVNTFCIIVFSLCVIAGFVINGNSFKGYGKLLMDSGYKVDFATKYGIGPCVINFGVYGLFILAYYNLVGAKFTGPTFGAIWNMLAFCAAGSTCLNVFPIMVGYVIAAQLGAFDINAQAIVIGLCYASGLAPVTGRYGWLAGIIGAMMHYGLVTSVPAIHGGFTVYNGGFTAGLVCFVLVPILESYVKPKEERKHFKWL